VLAVSIMLLADMLSFAPQRLAEHRHPRPPVAETAVAESPKGPTSPAWTTAQTAPRLPSEEPRREASRASQKRLVMRQAELQNRQLPLRAVEDAWSSRALGYNQAPASNWLKQFFPPQRF
jgi:hypothetical protein